jgi:replicative DNA helicase
MKDDEWLKYVSAINRIEQWKLYINDRVGASPLSIRKDAMQVSRMSGLGLIIVDYLQLLHPDANNRNWSRAEEVGSFAKSLKELAAELQVPVISAAQLNRSVEYRQDKRPTLADLRESGDIEQSADVVIGIHREDYYQPVTARTQDTFSHTEFIILKNRDGQTGIAHAGFYRHAKRFVPAFQQDGVYQYECKNLLPSE